jgi:hypothetical protein
MYISVFWCGFLAGAFAVVGVCILAALVASGVGRGSGHQPSAGAGQTIGGIEANPPRGGSGTNQMLANEMPTVRAHIVSTKEEGEPSRG